MPRARQRRRSPRPRASRDWSTETANASCSMIMKASPRPGGHRESLEPEGHAGMRETHLVIQRTSNIIVIVVAVDQRHGSGSRAGSPSGPGSHWRRARRFAPARAREPASCAFPKTTNDMLTVARSRPMPRASARGLAARDDATSRNKPCADATRYRGRPTGDRPGSRKKYAQRGRESKRQVHPHVDSGKLVRTVRLAARAMGRCERSPRCPARCAQKTTTTPKMTASNQEP